MSEGIEYLDEIARHLFERRAAVLVGAGFSKNAKLLQGDKLSPLWSELCEALLDELHLSEKDRELYRYKSIPELADMFESVYGRDKLNNLLEVTIRDKDYGPSDLHKQLLKLPWNNVLTTNYDTLLERAAKEVALECPNKKFTIILSEEDLLDSGGHNLIVKLHGSFPNPPYVLTTEDYRTYKDNFSSFCTAVKHCFTVNTVCLLGFSGDDPNFKNWLGELLDHFGKRKYQKIYTFLLKDPHPYQEDYLRSRNIVPVVLSRLFHSTENSPQFLISKTFSHLSQKLYEYEVLPFDKISKTSEEIISTNNWGALQVNSALKIVETWVSNDRKIYFHRFENGFCEQWGVADCVHNDVWITFPIEFANTEYAFLCESQNITFDILERNTCVIRLRLRVLQSSIKSIRWFAKGFSA